MQRQNTKIQPSHSRGSLVQSPDLPFIQQGENLLISASLLHKRLKVSTKFSDWIKRRIDKYGFEEGKDFYPNMGSKTKGRGGHNAIDFLFTLDTAKEMAMLEENETGRSIRRYFIAKEKELRGISQLPKQLELFKGLKPRRINDREMFPYREILIRSGYSPNANGTRRHRYWMHFIKEGKALFVTKEFALHLYHSKQVYNNRAVMQNSQPVLPFNFGDPLQLPLNAKGGSYV